MSFDRAAAKRTDLEFLNAQLSAPATRLLPLWREQHLLVQGALLLGTLGEHQHWIDAGGELVWLGELAGQACFAIDVSSLDQRQLPAGTQLADLRMLAATLTPPEVELAFFARALLIWHSLNGFCGRCGHETRPRKAGHMRVCANSGCEREHFPRTDPCSIVLVRDGDEVLLGRQPGWPKGMYSTLAGFIEPGETIEQATKREVLEETGVLIDELRYVSSQPWPFPASLMIGFTAHARSREIKLDDELEDARWVSRATLLALRGQDAPELWVPPPFSLAGQMLAAFMAETR